MLCNEETLVVTGDAAEIISIPTGLAGKRKDSIYTWIEMKTIYQSQQTSGTEGGYITDFRVLYPIAVRKPKHVPVVAEYYEPELIHWQLFG